MKIISLCLGLLCLTGINPVANAQDCPKVRVCFSPEQHCSANIIQEINQAKTSILVQAYSLTSSHIVKALVAAQKRGVKVAVIIDYSWFASNKSLSKAVRYLYENHTPIWLDDKVAIAHNKIIVIDSTTILTGSYNFTVSADVRNAENLLTITSPQLAKRYIANWNKRQSSALKLPAYRPDNKQELRQYMQKINAVHQQQKMHRDWAIKRSSRQIKN